jgi:ABC-type branched-subunit amino acid transport system ATPase component
VAPVLRLDDLRVSYGTVRALDGVSLEVDPGALLAVIGPNGAGKTTLLRAASGMLAFHKGRVVGGRVEAADSVAHVLEGRRVFPDLTVEENLRVGGFRVRDRAARHARVVATLDRFPLLAARRTLRAGLLSGGEQQLLAIAAALVASPRLLLLDEPAVGLADEAVALVAGVVADLQADGVAVVVAEQEPRLAALASAAPLVRLSRGRVVGAPVDDPVASPA